MSIIVYNINCIGLSSVLHNIVYCARIYTCTILCILLLYECIVQYCLVEPIFFTRSVQKKKKILSICSIR